jgi:hypothetical protein
MGICPQVIYRSHQFVTYRLCSGARFSQLKSIDVLKEAKVGSLSLSPDYLQELMPGGVSSPVRAFNAVGGSPVVFDHAKGAYAWDIDGNKFIDYVLSWGPCIAGHANDEVLDALRKTLSKGTRSEHS